MTHILAMEDLEAEPDDLVSYHFFAEDIGPDAKPRRTFSDMYFAEVRHFDEIFREGRQQSQSEQEQQQQQQSQQAQQAEKLAELQKQIINATWKLIRTDANVRPDQYLRDVALLAESQQVAIDRVDKLTEELDNEKSKTYAANARSLMAQAVDLLEPIDDVAKATTLVDALSMEQSAYQALLKLRAIEHEVQQQQQQPGPPSQQQRNSRSQQQLNQLELSSKENRYETRKDAQEQSQQASVNREELQILNRLRDLARRQDAINEKLKELESELRKAETSKEKETSHAS